MQPKKEEGPLCVLVVLCLDLGRSVGVLFFKMPQSNFQHLDFDGSL